MPRIRIQNVVATFSVGNEIDLEKVRKAFAKECFFETLNDKRFTFRVVALRFQKPRISLLVYGNGKVVSAGAKTLADARKSGSFFLERLRKADFDIAIVPKTKLRNIVATTDLRTPVDIERFIHSTRGEERFHVMYEPEQFPAAIVKFPVAQGSEATILLFNSGKMVCVGLTRYAHIQNAVELLTSKLISTQLHI